VTSNTGKLAMSIYSFSMTKFAGDVLQRVQDSISVENRVKTSYTPYSFELILEIEINEAKHAKLACICEHRQEERWIVQATIEYDKQSWSLSKSFNIVNDENVRDMALAASNSILKGISLLQMICDKEQALEQIVDEMKETINQIAISSGFKSN